MNIREHRLIRSNNQPFPYVPSPNIGGPLTKPRWLVMHFTAGRSAQESIDWMRDPASNVSAHVVVARDGAVTQMVPFNVVAHHAGASTWKGVTGLNHRSIGMELDNLGKLKRERGAWWSWQNVRVPDGDVFIDVHQQGWHAYTAAQLASARMVASALVKTYGLEDVIGHSDISPGRKFDPGPAFPMAEFRREVMEPPVRHPVSPLARAIVDQRWQQRDDVTPEHLQDATRTILRLLEPAVKRGVEGAPEMHDALQGVLAFYGRAAA